MIFTKNHKVVALNWRKPLDDGRIMGPQKVLVSFKGVPYLIDGTLGPKEYTIKIKVRRRWWIFGSPKIVAADLGWGMHPVRATAL